MNITKNIFTKKQEQCQEKFYNTYASSKSVKFRSEGRDILLLNLNLVWSKAFSKSW